jgi:hypothetical protein
MTLIKNQDFTNTINHRNVTFKEIELNLIEKGVKLLNGGKSFARVNHECDATTNIAIIIPYRNRLKNLKVWLNNMHPYLTKQRINYGIYLIEPVEEIAFNRALLINIGFVEAIKDTLSSPLAKHSIDLNISRVQTVRIETQWDCFLFHDVDM